jgi:hypothetical protein
LHKIYTPGENGSRFLSEVQKLATSVDIYDPDAVSKVLSMHFTESERSFPPYGSVCSDSYAQKAAGAHIFIPTASWFKQSPEGVPEMFVPAMFINPAFKQGNPSFSYSITRTEMCTGRMDLRNHQQASIKFDNLSGFSCLTPAELVHELHAQYQMATDGFSSYTVSGQSSDGFGSGVTFEFRAGAPCALWAEVWQADEAGYRYNRAYAKFRVCKKAALAQFCKTDFPVGTGFFQALEDVYYRNCGGIGDFFDREPLTGVPSDGAKWIRGENRCPLNEK